MLYEEFNQYKNIKSDVNQLCNYYEDDENNSFFVEPGFYAILMRYKDNFVDSYKRIMEYIDKLIKENHKIIFTADYEHPFVNVNDYIYVEMDDITDHLNCTFAVITSPSDYGD